MRFMPAQVFERLDVLEGKSERLQRVVEAQDVDGAWDVTGRAQGGQGVGGSTQAHIPQDELVRVAPRPFGQAKLVDI